MRFFQVAVHDEFFCLFASFIMAGEEHAALTVELIKGMASERGLTVHVYTDEAFPPTPDRVEAFLDQLPSPDSPRSQDNGPLVTYTASAPEHQQTHLFPADDAYSNGL